jgi:hypothetical protein
MPSRILFAVALVLASGAALSKMSECEADCEDVYKACVTSGKTNLLTFSVQTPDKPVLLGRLAPVAGAFPAPCRRPPPPAAPCR